MCFLCTANQGKPLCFLSEGVVVVTVLEQTGDTFSCIAHLNCGCHGHGILPERQAWVSELLDTFTK